MTARHVVERGAAANPVTHDVAGALKRDVRLIDIVTLGAGAAIGVSVFSIFAPAAAVAGSGMLISLGIAALPMIVFALVYAFMASAAPFTRAAFVWPTRFIGPFAGFMISWLRVLGSIGVMVVLAQVLVQYWSSLVPLPLKPTMFGLFLFFYLLNLFGVAAASRAQTVLFALMATALILLVGGSVPHLDATNFSPLLAHGWTGLIAAVPLLVSLFLGIESAVEVGEEVRDARKTISRGIFISAAVTLAIYVSVSIAVLGTLGADAVAASKAPLLDLAGAVFGRTAEVFIVVAATLAIAKSLNAVMMIFSRYLFAMGREGVLPAAVGRIHPKWGTPHVSTTLAFVCCTLGLLLPNSLVFLFLAINIPMMFQYLGVCFSALRVLKGHPDLYERAWFKPNRTVLTVGAWAGVLCAIAIVAAGFSADWRPYAIFAVWAVVGSLYWKFRSS